MHLHWQDELILLTYFAFVILIGWLQKKKVKSSSEFLTSRSLPLWITSLAFISANLGAQEVLGMAASGAKYGLMTAHFYWIGAIPAMLFLGIFMMPFYYGSRARSVPEYLALRFDEKTRALNAVTFALLTVVTAGISLYGLAVLLKALLGWPFAFSIVLAAGIVAVYTFAGGLASAIYNEVLQFFLIVLGIFPLVVVGLIHVGGYAGLAENLKAEMMQVWRPLQSANPMGVSASHIILGLGFVLSFGYWCTDFLVVQRAMSSGSMRNASRTSIVAAFPKIFLPFIVILPGLIALALAHKSSSFALPLKPDGRIDYDMTLPSLLLRFYPSGLLGLGLTALMASFMSGMAGGVTAFNSVWTYDIYQAYIKPSATDKHYLFVARLANVGGIIASIGFAYLAMRYNNIMDLVQLVCGFINAPLLATFLLGMFWKRTSSEGAFWGLAGGTLAAIAFYSVSSAESQSSWLLQNPYFQFSSGMAQAVSVALVAWVCCFILTIVLSLLVPEKNKKDLKGLVYTGFSSPEVKESFKFTRITDPLPLSLIVLSITVLVNLIFF